jgi:hypothetical protein
VDTAKQAVEAAIACIEGKLQGDRDGK